MPLLYDVRPAGRLHVVLKDVNSAYANATVVSCGCVNFKMDSKAGEMTGNIKIPPAASLAS